MLYPGAPMSGFMMSSFVGPQEVKYAAIGLCCESESDSRGLPVALMAATETTWRPFDPTPE